MWPKVSIISINFNGLKYLSDFFTSLKKLDYPNYELIMVDNASVDGSLDFLEKQTGINLIVNKDNTGFTANNKAVLKAKGEYLLFLNNDMKVKPDFLRLMIEKMKTDASIGILGCRISDYRGKKTFHIGIGIDIFGFPIIRKPIFYIEGSALMIRKNLFKKINGFDSKYFMFHEDIDLAWRVKLLGLKVKAEKEAIVYHAVGGSAGGGPSPKGKYRSSYLRRYYSERNNLRTILKNYELSTLIAVLPLYFCINLGEMLFFLFLIRFRLIYLYLKAYLWNFLNLADTLKQRREIQKSRIVSDREIMKEMYFGSAKLKGLIRIGLPTFK